jgi:hypothetical protein
MKSLLKVILIYYLILTSAIVFNKTNVSKSSKSNGTNQIFKENIDALIDQLPSIHNELENIIQGEHGLDNETIKLYLYFKVRGYLSNDKLYDPEFEDAECVVGKILRFEASKRIEIIQMIDELVSVLDSLFEFQEGDKDEIQFTTKDNMDDKFNKIKFKLQPRLEAFNTVLSECYINPQSDPKTFKKKISDFLSKLKLTRKPKLSLLNKKRIKEISSIICSLATFCKITF